MKAKNYLDYGHKIQFIYFIIYIYILFAAWPSSYV